MILVRGATYNRGRERKNAEVRESKRSGSGRNKGKFATVIVNISQSKMGYREEAKNKGGSRKCKVRGREV